MPGISASRRPIEFCLFDAYTINMRKVGLLLLLLGGTFANLQAEPYSHLEDVAVQPQTFLAHRLVTADSIRYCVAAYPSTVSSSDIDTLVQAALREWTHGIALQIRQSGREEDFKDILALLEKPLTLQAVTGCTAPTRTPKTVSPSAPQADIVFVVSGKYCEKEFKKTTPFYSPATDKRGPFICVLENGAENPLREIYANEYLPQATSPAAQKILQERRELFNRIASGDYSSAQQQALWKTNRFFAYDGPTLFSVIVHELGHAFGLGDENLSSRPTDYASQKPGNGIMKRLYEPIGCDEIDGLVTLLDRLNHTQRTFRSFCPDRDLIENGTEHAS